jgi:hypothetical protein
MTLPCDRRTDEEHLDDLNVALEDLDAARGIIVGTLGSLLFWLAIALLVLA